MKNVYFVHGWGFNPDLWRALAAQLFTIEPHFVDLGFVSGYKGPVVEEIPPGAIVAGHSLGAMWLLKQRQDFKAFISLGGFDCFHAHVPAREIDAMKSHLRRNAAAQMQGFWRSGGTRDFAPESALNVAALQNGLDWLSSWDARKERAALKCPVLPLATENDSIVTKAMTKAIWKRRDIRWLETGGHAMAMTVPAWCARQIEDFVHELE